MEEAICEFVIQDNKLFPGFNVLTGASLHQHPAENKSYLMKFSTKLIGGRLVRRYRRFLIDVQLESGAIVTAHCPNSGTMVGCSEPGSCVLLSESSDPHRRNAYTWEMIQMNNTWIGINVALARKVVAEGIQGRLIPSLQQYRELQTDAEYGRGNKIDILMHGIDQNVFANVYHVAWVENGVAQFPETPNARARKGLKELTDIAAQGHRALAIYFVQRGDCSTFSPCEAIDPEFKKLFFSAVDKGVEVMAYRASITPQEITLGNPIPVK